MFWCTNHRRTPEQDEVLFSALAEAWIAERWREWWQKFSMAQCNPACVLLMKELKLVLNMELRGAGMGAGVSAVLELGTYIIWWHCVSQIWNTAMLEGFSRHWMWPRTSSRFCLKIFCTFTETAQSALCTTSLGIVTDWSSLSCSLPVPLDALHVFQYPFGLFLRGLKSNPTSCLSISNCACPSIAPFIP